MIKYIHNIIKNYLHNIVIKCIKKILLKTYGININLNIILGKNNYKN